MRNKSLFLMLACVCGTVAAISVNQWMEARPTAAPTELVEIFVTAQEIEEQEEITADKIRLEGWPADRVPTGATSELTELEGRYAKQMFLAGEPVLIAKLMNEKDDVIVPKGHRVVAMKADQNSGIANLVKIGDRVDVDGYFTKNELFPETKTMTILAGVKVFAIDGKTKLEEETRTRSARSISLLIRSADHEAWMLAQKNGEVSLSLGSPGGPSNSDLAEDEPSEAGAKFLKWMDDHRAEQRRIREEEERRRREEGERAKAQQETTSEEVAPKSKKGVFRMTKLENGRMVVYEFTPGNPVPVKIADTGDPNAETIDDQDLDTETTEGPTAGGEESTSEFNGDDSPFFQPDE